MCNYVINDIQDEYDHYASLLNCFVFKIKYLKFQVFEESEIIHFV